MKKWVVRWKELLIPAGVVLAIGSGMISVLYTMVLAARQHGDAADAAIYATAAIIVAGSTGLGILFSIVVGYVVDWCERKK